MQEFLVEHPFILLEGAIIEQLRRNPSVKLHPRLEHALLIYELDTKQILEKLFVEYIEVAKNAHLPLIILTPTWRTNKQRLEEAGVERDVNSDAVKFMKQIQNKYSNDTEIKIGGLTGCKNDCYKPEEALLIDEAEEFHSWQIKKLARAGIDFLLASTLPALSEAIGISQAMSKTGLPYIISFVIGKNGHLLDGTPLPEAVQVIDESVETIPLGYMVNCSYPTFLCPQLQPEQLFRRLIGFQANASSLDHSMLDASDIVHRNDSAEWGQEMMQLFTKYGIKMLGGCCGTSPEHLKYLAERIGFNLQ